MNDLLQGVLAGFIGRTLRRPEMLEIMAHGTFPTQVRTPLHRSQVTLALLSMAGATINGQHDLAEMTFRELLRRRSARLDADYTTVPLDNHELAIVFYGSGADRGMVISGTVQDFANRYAHPEQERPPIVYAVSSPLEAEYALYRFNRYAGGNFAATHDRHRYEAARMTYEIAAARLQVDNLMDELYYLSCDMQGVESSSWESIAHLLERYSLVRGVMDHIDPVNVRGLASGRPEDLMNRLGAMVQYVIAQTVIRPHQERRYLDDQQDQFDEWRDSLFAVYAMDLVIQAEAALRGDADAQGL